METKKCKKCNNDKLLIEFNKGHKLQNGNRALYSYCKNCSKIILRNNYDNKKEVKKEKRIEWHKNNPNYMEEWRKNNWDKYVNNAKQYRELNKDKLKNL